MACWFQCWEIQPVCFDKSNNTGALDVKMDGSVLEEKSLRNWGWLCLLNWIRALVLSLLLKLPPRKLKPWFILWSFFLLRLLCISLNLPYGHVWNTVVMSGLVLLVTTWNCWITYKNGYAGLLVLHFLPLLNPLLIVQGVNQKITIAAVRPRLGKRVQGACVPKCSWGFRVGGGLLWAPSPSRVLWGMSPLEKILRP